MAVVEEINPLVSVVIPNYNNRGYLKDCIDSVFAQTIQNFEIVVIDDCSTDDSLVLLNEMQKNDSRIRIISNAVNKGVAASRNLGFHAAKGKYIALLDSDDIWKKNKLEMQIELLEKENADICYCSYEYCNKDAILCGISYRVPVRTTYFKLLKENVIGCSTVLIKSDSLRGFQMDSKYSHEDYVLWLEMLKSGKRAVGIQEILVICHTGGRSSKKVQAAKNRWAVYRKSQNLPIFTAAIYFSCYCILGFFKYYLFKKSH